MSSRRAEQDSQCYEHDLTLSLGLYAFKGCAHQWEASPFLSTSDGNCRLLIRIIGCRGSLIGTTPLVIESEI